MAKVRVTYLDHEKAAPSVTVGGRLFEHKEPVELDEQEDAAVLGLLKTMHDKKNPFFKIEGMRSEPGHPADRPAAAQSDADKDESDETLRRRGPGRPKGT